MKGIALVTEGKMKSRRCRGKASSGNLKRPRQKLEAGKPLAGLRKPAR
jgi:hypothetical protein